MSTQAEAELKRAITGARPYFHQEDIPEILGRVENILRGGRLIFGDNTREFEESFRAEVGTEHAVCVNSCTTAIEIALRFYEVRDREVIVPTNTFASAVKAVIYAGGVPVLADMDAHTFCLDVDDALARVTPRTAGVIAVHLAGLIDPQFERLRQLCRERGLFLIEDGSHAHGASIDGRKAGSLADVGCFSFYPTKIMTTGTGGIVVTDNAELADFARSLRHHGQGQGLEDIVNLGNDWCMDELSAVLGIYQLKRLGESVEHRRQLVEWYREELAGDGWLAIPDYPPNVRHAYYKIAVLLEPGIDKNRLRRILRDEHRIDIGSLYDPPCHLQPVFQKQLGYRRGMFPQAEAALLRQTCLPTHALVSRDDVAATADALRQAVGRCRG
ncbi:MAG: DegT/DnrJ/EryC1/StrS family aminotransferase [Acidobacteria bacterium]|nr:DegT/DnrJ/EryC1/StrS family aminotransferase [Acidobacteriota bacterium]